MSACLRNSTADLIRGSLGFSPEARSGVGGQGGVSAVGVALHVDVLGVIIADAGWVFFPTAAFALDAVQEGLGPFNGRVDVLGGGWDVLTGSGGCRRSEPYCRTAEEEKQADVKSG